MDSLEIICKTKINKDDPKIKNSLITEIPDLLRQSQSEFSKPAEYMPAHYLIKRVNH